MEQKWRIFGALGEWTMTVTLVPGPEAEISESVAQRALERFQSLEPHLCDVVNLTEALELAVR